MNYVKRAIIMAAGKGTRLMPLTEETPKPLISVNGTRMIDSIIEALFAKDIREIYIVVGYLKEKFEILKEKYPEIQFIENPYFDSANNISSLYVARDYTSEAIILDGDQMIYNPEILSKEFLYSGYNCVRTEEKTEEWVLELNGDTVVSCQKGSETGGWQLFSISRWSYEDGQRLKRLLELEFHEKRNRQVYWDDVPLFLHLDEFTLGIREMKKEDIIEVDSLEELIRLDSSYEKWSAYECV